MKQFDEFRTLVGKKRLLIVVVMVMLTAGSAWAWQKYLLPENTVLKNTLQSVMADVGRIQTDITSLPQKYADLKAKEEAYDNLLASGLMADQDRIKARETLDALRLSSGLRGLAYNIEPIEDLKDQELKNIQKKMISSNIKLTLKGLTDLEMRDYLAKMMTDFGGLVTIHEVSLKRNAELNEENLQKLSQKEPIDFIIGEAALNWISIAPLDADDNTQLNQAFGGGTP